jgi:hypothetical protein
MNNCIYLFIDVYFFFSNFIDQVGTKKKKKKEIETACKQTIPLALVPLSISFTKGKSFVA